MPGLTLQERYYGINENLNKFLQSKYIDCPVLKYGIDVATLKTDTKKAEKIYPYAMTSINNISSNAWTSEESGIFTRFDYQVNFFTSPKTEFTNDAKLFKPFEFIKLAFTDINKTVLEIIDKDDNITMLADILNVSEMSGFGVISGAVTPSKILIVKFAAICGYPESIGSNGYATDTSKALGFDFII